MDKKIIIWILAFLFLIVLTEYAYAAACAFIDNNLTGSKTVNRNIIITKNGRVNVYLYWRCSANNADSGGKSFLQYGANTTGLDDSSSGFNITTSCGSKAFKIVNLTGNNTNSCSTGQAAAHGCVRDSSLGISGFKAGGNSSWINFSARDSVPTNTEERLTFGIRSCNVSGVFDIGDGGLPVTQGDTPTITFDNWFNITVAQTLFSNITASNSSYRKIYHINTSSPPANQTVNISIRITNEDDINFHIFSTNVTGTWKNRTASNVRVSGSADTDIVNWTTLDINTSCSAAACTNTKKVGWRIYANDSSRMHNASAINIISPQAAQAGNSCTPPGSGDWIITDVCYKSNENINLASGGRVLILAGGLLICDRTNVTAAGSTPIMIILGQSLTKLISNGASNC